MSAALNPNMVGETGEGSRWEYHLDGRAVVAQLIPLTAGQSRAGEVTLLHMTTFFEVSRSAPEKSPVQDSGLLLFCNWGGVKDRLGELIIMLKNNPKMYSMPQTFKAKLFSFETTCWGSGHVVLR